MTSPLSRRALIGGLAAGAVAAPAILRAQLPFAAYPFRLGVASGEPAADGFVIWTRLAPEPFEPHGGMPMAPVEVQWQVAPDPAMRMIARDGVAVARPELGHAVHVELTGLDADRPYWYRFTCGRERSGIGRARTLPAAGSSPATLRFAVAGCQNYEDGLYTAHRHLAAEEDVAFVYHYGDYIYEGRSAPVPFGWDGQPRPFVRAHLGAEPYSLDDYRRRYAQYRIDPDLQAAHGAHSWFTTFDDHEIVNNWVSDIAPDGTPPAIFRLRRAAAFQAYYEHMPLRMASFPTAEGIRLHRRQRFGDLLDAHFLDTRQYRTDQPCGDGFKPDCAEVDNPQASLLGAAQEQWLARGLKERAGRWNLLAQQIMVMRLDRRTGDEPAPIRNLDSWAGYTAPRERFVGGLAGLGNAVVITGDEHQNHAGVLRTNGGAGDPAAVEFVATSISSGGDGQDKRRNTDRLIDASPELEWTNDQRGYLLCDVGRDLWQTRFRVVDRVTTPGGAITTRATATVEHGRPALTIE